MTSDRTDRFQKALNNLDLICDYLKNESKDSDDDCKRKGKLYELFELDHDEKKRTCPFLPGPLGAAIVSLYYEVQKIPYEEKPSNPEVSPESKKLRPDGLENDQFYVEVKMRSYHSPGTAAEKIPSVPWKYSQASKKLKIFLLADDEHKYNVFWSKLMTGKLEPRNQFQQKLLQTNSVILEKVVLGTDVVDVFESFNSSTP